MTVILLERVTVSMRGELTRWMLEPKPGVFVGKLSAMVRDRLWEWVCERLGDGGGMLLHVTDNEQGFTLRFHGQTTRTVRDFEGLMLIQLPL